MQDGSYHGRPTTASVYEKENGNLVLCVGIQIQDGPELKSYHTLYTEKDGVNTKTIGNIKAWSGWDGQDPFWFVDMDLSETDVDVVVENRPGTKNPEKMFPNIKWVNPPGGGGNAPRECGDRKAILAKYGAKFRAIAGGSPASKPTAPVAQPTPPAPSRAPSAPAAPTLPTSEKVESTMDECWKAFSEKNAKFTQAKREELWFETVDASGKGKGQDAFTPDDWGKLLGSINDNLQF